MKVYGAQQLLSTRIPHLTAELDRVEALTVAELARTVHADGYRFVDWPTVTRTWVGHRPTGEVELPVGHLAAWHVRIHVEAVAEER